MCVAIFCFCILALWRSGNGNFRRKSSHASGRTESAGFQPPDSPGIPVVLTNTALCVLNRSLCISCWTLLHHIVVVVSSTLRKNLQSLQFAQNSDTNVFSSITKLHCLNIFNLLENFNFGKLYLTAFQCIIHLFLLHYISEEIYYCSLFRSEENENDMWFEMNHSFESMCLLNWFTDSTEWFIWELDGSDSVLF